MNSINIMNSMNSINILNSINIINSMNSIHIMNSTGLATYPNNRILQAQRLEKNNVHGDFS